MPAKKSKSKKQKTNYNKDILNYTYYLAIIILLSVTGVNINNFFEHQKVLGAQVDITPFQNEKAYWQKIINDNPTFTDGYLEIAKVDVEIGNKIEAYDYINKALSIDPNSTRIPEVIKSLGL